MEKKKYKIVTLGCRTNQYESQAYATQLRKKGFVEARAGEKVDLCLVNTCTVTQSADQKSLAQIRKVSKQYQVEKLVVTGCFAEKGKEALETLGIPLERIPNANKEQALSTIFPEEEWSEFTIDHFAAHTRAFVKVQDGCNSYCSYCVIPFVRGRSRSRKGEEIVEEVHQLVENGYREIVLTGINIGDFDGRGGKINSLAQLVKVLDEIPGLSRIRLSSIDPDEVEEDLLEAITEGKKTCHSMHIVLQSGSNIILKRMRRKYTTYDFLLAIEKLKNKSERFTFTTDIIVGFPGETEKDFEATLAVAREVGFAKIHVFPYSDREKTRASRMDGKIPPQVIEQRKNDLLALHESTSYALRNQYLGSRCELLLEKKEKDRFLYGHSDNFLPVYVKQEKKINELRPNELVWVRCVENTKEGLIGEVIDAKAN